MPISLDVVFDKDGAYLRPGSTQAGNPIDVDTLNLLVQNLDLVADGPIPLEKIETVVPAKYSDFVKMAADFSTLIAEQSTYITSRCSGPGQFEKTAALRASLDSRQTRFAFLLKAAVTRLDDETVQLMQIELSGLVAAVAKIKAQVEEMCPEMPSSFGTRALITAASVMSDAAWRAMDLSFRAAQAVIGMLKALANTTGYILSYIASLIPTSVYAMAALGAMAYGMLPPIAKEALAFLASTVYAPIHWGRSVYAHGLFHEKSIEAAWDLAYRMAIVVFGVGVIVAVLWTMRWFVKLGMAMAKEEFFGGGGGDDGGGGGGRNFLPMVAPSRQLSVYRPVQLPLSPAALEMLAAVQVPSPLAVMEAVRTNLPVPYTVPLPTSPINGNNAVSTDVLVGGGTIASLGLAFLFGAKSAYATGAPPPAILASALANTLFTANKLIFTRSIVNEIVEKTQGGLDPILSSALEFVLGAMVDPITTATNFGKRAAGGALSVTVKVAGGAGTVLKAVTDVVNNQNAVRLFNEAARFIGGPLPAERAAKIAARALIAQQIQ